VAQLAELVGLVLQLVGQAVDGAAEVDLQLGELLDDALDGVAGGSLDDLAGLGLLRRLGLGGYRRRALAEGLQQGREGLEHVVAGHRGGQTGRHVLLLACGPRARAATAVCQRGWGAETAVGVARSSAGTDGGTLPAFLLQGRSCASRAEQRSTALRA